MTFTDWFFTWPVLAFGILVVAATRIWFDRWIRKHDEDDDA